MTCEVIKLGEKATAIVCHRGRKPTRCKWCEKPHSKLCDYPVNGKTCDAKMCADHATSVGKDKDHCPNHKEQKPC